MKSHPINDIDYANREGIKSVDCQHNYYIPVIDEPYESRTVPLVSLLSIELQSAFMVEIDGGDVGLRQLQLCFIASDS